MKGINFRRSFLLIFLVFIFIGSAFADKGVFNAKVTPDEAFVNEPTTITVTAEIGAENLYISSVRAYKTTADGKPIALLGQMYDDGTHGDVREADTIFTIQFTVNEPVESTIYVRVTAAYRRDRNRYLSSVLPIKIYKHLPDGILEELNSVVSEIKENFERNVQELGLEQARQKAYEEALANPNITSAILSGSNLWITYKDTIQGVVGLDDPEYPSLGAGRSIPFNLPDNIKGPGNDKVLIFAPYYMEWYNFFSMKRLRDVSNYAKSKFQDAEYMSFLPDPMEITKNEAASLDLVKKWGEYGTVIIETHGAWEPNTNRVCLATGTNAIQAKASDPTISFDLQSTPRRLAVISNGNLCVFPEYIKKRAKPMVNTFFWLGACSSMKSESFWNALKVKGAKVALGWSEEVCVAFSDEPFKELIDNMVPIDNSSDPMSVQDAYDAISQKTDDTGLLGWDAPCNHHAHLELRTASSEWQNFVFFEGGLINGDFETGDWTGWVHGGDYNYRIIAGSRKHNGSYSAALGRWDTSYHGHDPTAEPYGYEWFYQDFVVPNNVTYLKFNWWMETYDTAAWDWFDAYIKDTNGNTLITIVNRGGKPGYNYGPYWTTGGWREESVDISAYRGRKIRIYFDQRLDGWGDQQRVYIDDVRLE